MISLFSHLQTTERCLDYQVRRHALLASNIANAETPGYRPQDLSFDAYLSKMGQLTTTEGRHMEAVGGSRYQMSLFEDPVDSPGNDGNGVSMEREMGKVVANTHRFQASVEMIQRRLSLLKYAATNGQRR